MTKDEVNNQEWDDEETMQQKTAKSIKDAFQNPNQAYQDKWNKLKQYIAPQPSKGK